MAQNIALALAIGGKSRCEAVNSDPRTSRSGSLCPGESSHVRGCLQDPNGCKSV